MKGKQTKVAGWSLIIAIVILLNLFFNYSLSLIFNSPEYDDYCDNRPVYVEKMSTEESQELAKKERECYDMYDTARDEYEKKVFISLISIGVVVFILSLVPALNYVVATSLSLGAVLDFVIASMRYWGSADEILKVIILGLALSILIWIGIKKFGDN